MAGPYQTTKDGLELQFGSNHIGHFLFTNLIMPKVLASNNPRIINVSSNGHKLSPIRFEDWNFQDGKAYHQWRAYGQSKTANVLFSKALAEKLGSTKKLRAYSLHPGVIFETSLAPQGVTDADWAEMAALNKELGIDLPLIKMKTLDEGTACHVVAAFDTRLGDFNGAYLEDGNLSDDVTATATDPEEAEKLWKLSEKLVGQTFDY
jgi:NAD(P)-dependent dehydrogenase (short-subunit alcohol dehydrogenase family)